VQARNNNNKAAMPQLTASQRTGGVP